MYDATGKTWEERIALPEIRKTLQSLEWIESCLEDVETPASKKKLNEAIQKLQETVSELLREIPLQK